MEVYVARQPVFDRKMNTYGYELLYRRTQENIFDGTDSSRATAELIHNAFLVMNLTDLTDGGRGFINFSGDLLVAGVPAMLPDEQIVVEILETVEPTEEILAACRQLKKAGYLLALDDFVLESRRRPPGPAGGHHQGGLPPDPPAGAEPPHGSLTGPAAGT